MKRSYNIHRWYRSAWGRYTQADPIGLLGGINTYQYSDGDPIDEIDLYGLAGCPPNVIAFINNMCQAAKTAAGENCPCRAMLIQSGFESGWGTGSTVPDNNYFGLHGEGNAGFRMSKPKNPKTKPVKLPINKKPEDSYKQYCHRCAVYDVTYKDDSQFVTDVTHKLTFSVYTQPSYIKNILGMMKKCDSELRACCGK